MLRMTHWFVMAGCLIVPALSWDAFQEKGQPAPKAAKELELDLGGGVKMKFIRIDPGKFLMGSPEGEWGHAKDEFQHEVELTHAYYMAIYPTTRAQFKAFVAAAAYKTEPEKGGKGGRGYNAAANRLEPQNPKYNWNNTGFEQSDMHPVINVTWNDAKAFCKWLSEKTGHKATLPTEAEWEYACRAGTKTAYCTGDNEGSLWGSANLADLTFWDKFPSRNDAADFHDNYVFTSPVDRFKANPWGLHDVHGNVGTWCEDWYGAEYYKDPAAKKDPTGPAKGDWRVLRGGSWQYNTDWCRSAYRTAGFPGNDAYSHYGIRVVVGLPQKAP